MACILTCFCWACQPVGHQKLPHKRWCPGDSKHNQNGHQHLYHLKFVDQMLLSLFGVTTRTGGRLQHCETFDILLGVLLSVKNCLPPRDQGNSCWTTSIGLVCEAALQPNRREEKPPAAQPIKTQKSLVLRTPLRFLVSSSFFRFSALCAGSPPSELRKKDEQLTKVIAFETSVCSRQNKACTMPDSDKQLCETKQSQL